MVNLVSRRSSLILAAASLTPLGELKRWKQIAEQGGILRRSKDEV